MILVYPHNDDWDRIAALTGDASWRAAQMRGYFERLEDCRYRRLDRWLAKLGLNPRATAGTAGSGREGDPPSGARAIVDCSGDRSKRRRSALRGSRRPLGSARAGCREGLADPNDWRLVAANADGLRFMPLTTAPSRAHRHRASGCWTSRDASGSAEAHRAATRWRRRVLFDDDQPGDRRRVSARASGSIARPSRRPTRPARQRRTRLARARSDPRRRRLQHAAAADALGHRAGGAAAPATASRCASTCRASARNLQDRYEVGVVNRMADRLGHARRRHLHARRSAVRASGRTARRASTPPTARCSP